MYSFAGKNFEYFELDDHQQHQKNVTKYNIKKQHQQQQQQNSGGTVGTPSTTTTPISENFNYEKRNSAIAESTVSGHSEATTAVLSSSSGIGGCGDMSCGSASETGAGVCGGGGGCSYNDNNVRENEIEGQHRWDNRRRRHAINITSNPGYQVRAFEFIFISELLFPKLICYYLFIFHFKYLTFVHALIHLYRFFTAHTQH